MTSAKRTPERCFQWFKDTNLKANHNGFHAGHKVTKVVSNGSKTVSYTHLGRGQPKCFHNGIILIVTCFKLVLQNYEINM